MSMLEASIKSNAKPLGYRAQPASISAKFSPFLQPLTERFDWS
jgi:hypothetical protein